MYLLCFMFVDTAFLLRGADICDLLQFSYKPGNKSHLHCTCRNRTTTDSFLVSVPTICHLHNGLLRKRLKVHDLH